MAGQIVKVNRPAPQPLNEEDESVFVRTSTKSGQISARD